MRVRNRKGAGEMLAENAHIVVENPAEFKGRWSERFGNDYPIHIEVGCGKGAFITGMAALHPEINYIAIDMQLSVLSYAFSIIQFSIFPVLLSKLMPTLVIGLPLSANRL